MNIQKIISMVQRTFVLLKPDAVLRGLVGEIIRRFERKGMKIVAMKMVYIDEEHAGKHYEEHKGKPFYDSLVGYLTSGPVVAMVIEGANAIENVRKLIGSTEPASAQPGTIRGDFAHITYSRADNTGRPVTNLIHASDSEESAKREIELWFKPEEIHTYELPYEHLTI